MLAQVVTFTNVLGVAADYEPVPASKVIPTWYKETPEYVGGRRTVLEGMTSHTIKKCMPVFDAMTAGYIIPAYVDVLVTQRDGVPWYEWPNHSAITFHPVTQAPNHPNGNGLPIPKWSNPWGISTPRGYSCLFLPPMHHSHDVFSILPAVVDTDVYQAPVNFPFMLRDPNWEGLIRAGTPLVQVIPLRRGQWKSRIGGSADIKMQQETSNRVRSMWFNAYKRLFWTRKEYR